MNELRESFWKETADLYEAEQQWAKMLPKIAEAALNAELKGALKSELQQTKAHADRLAKTLKRLGQSPTGKQCQAMQGLVAQAEELIDEEASDAALICAIQKTKHYEIASYGALCSWASLLEENEILDLITETLEEIKTADETLTQIAESTVNLEAAEGEAEEDEAAS